MIDPEDNAREEGYREGFLAGAEAMRERAENIFNDSMHSDWRAGEVVEVIKALSLEAEKGKS